MPACRPCSRKLTPPLSKDMKAAQRVFASKLIRSYAGRMDRETAGIIARELAIEGKLTPAGELKKKRKVKGE